MDKIKAKTEHLRSGTMDKEKKYIVDNYGSESHAIESEALLAELNLTDGQIIQAIEEKCYFPE